jgi:hypothetical protein
LSGTTPVWTRADIARATREARRATANPAQAPIAPGNDTVAPAHQSTAQPRCGARSATRGAETPQTTTPAEPPRYARIIRAAAKRTAGGRDAQTAVGVVGVSRGPARDEAAAAERFEHTLASVFETAPCAEARPDRDMLTVGRGIASISKKRRPIDLSAAARAKTTRAAEAAGPVCGVASQSNPQAGRRGAVRLSLPQNGRGGRD